MKAISQNLSLVHTSYMFSNIWLYKTGLNVKWLKTGGMMLGKTQLSVPVPKKSAFYSTDQKA